MTDPLTVQTFPLDHVFANPYQPRTADDPAHVAALAEDIAARGLLQIPVARPHPDRPGQAQLAFGHSRLAAYHRLADDSGFLIEDRSAWQRFPVLLRALSDREMSDLAAAENMQRRNLTPIEVARALRQRIRDFGLTQAEAGAPFGLSQSAAAHALRLLKLPEAVQHSVHAGELPERLARQMVTIAQTAPAEVEQLAKRVAKLAPENREARLNQGLYRILEEHGHELDGAPWNDAWLKTPLPLDAPDGDLTELRACRGCPSQFKSRWEAFCTRPTCYEAKEKLWYANELEQASRRLDIPAAGPDETVTPLKFKWDDEGDARRLLKAARKRPDLGLRLVTIEKDVSTLGRTVLGSNSVALATTDVPAVNIFLKAGAEAGTNKAGKTSPAQDVKAAKAAEEKARARRRAERVLALQVEADVTWIIQHASEWIGRQLPISGGLLRYAVSNLESSSALDGREFPDLAAFESEIDEAMQTARGAEGERLLRQHLALSFLLNDYFDYYGQKKKDQEFWSNVQEAIRNLVSVDDARAEALEDVGLALKLPAGWSKPPIHHTGYNCWHCGRFTAQKKLTKRDIAEGWGCEHDDKKQLVNVGCPDCGGAKAITKDLQTGRLGRKPKARKK